jgi:tetratricopeptide (TPR) repeat protein
MGVGILWSARAALAATALAGWTALLAGPAVAGGQDDFAPGLEIKHIGPNGRVTLETLSDVDASSEPAEAPSAAPLNKTQFKPAIKKKLVPFPEDEAESGNRPAPASGRPEPSKRSNFQPHFKTPAVRQVQHLEPAEENGWAPELAGPQLQRVPAQVDALDSPGRHLVDEAFAKSQAAHSDGDYTEVIDMCRRGLDAGLKKSYEDYARRLLGWSYNRRGEIRAEEGRDKDALADFEAAVECNRSSWRAIHNRAVSYASQSRLKEALADFNRTIELNKKYPNAYFNRAELKYGQGDFPGALHDYSAALALNPMDATVLNGRGHAFYRLERFGEALRDYSAALKIDPAFTAALINRGDTFADLGQYAEAATDYRNAVSAAPTSGRAYQAAAWLMATCPDEHYRHDALALDAARKAIKLDGDADYRYLETLAAAQANAGKFSEAKETQEKAISKVPRGEHVAAEKRMSLYQRDLAYRERPRVAYKPPEERQDKQVRPASGTSPQHPARLFGPRRAQQVPAS